MKKASLLAIGTIPGVVVCYAVLTGFLVKKVRPVPIVKMGAPSTPTNRRSRQQPSLLQTG